MPLTLSTNPSAWTKVLMKTLPQCAEEVYIDGERTLYVLSDRLLVDLFNTIDAVTNDLIEEEAEHWRTVLDYRWRM